MIKNSKAFCVNFMSIDNEEQVLFCGTESGRNIDKLSETGLGTKECKKIDCPRVKEALAHLECEVFNAVNAGDHTIFIGQVVHSESKKKGKRILQEGSGFTTTE